MSDRSIADLHPTIRPLACKFIDRCEAVGLNIKITFTYRSPEEQDEYYAQGRTKPGNIVTNLDGRHSKHCFTIDGKPASKAFDFGVYENGVYITNGSDPRYTRAGIICESLGMQWGGRWKHPYDPGHCEIT